MNPAREIETKLHCEHRRNARAALGLLTAVSFLFGIIVSSIAEKYKAGTKEGNLEKAYQKDLCRST